jgi:transcriptional regulator with XRE-family HTH domain
MKQTELAKALGVSKAYVSMIMSGKKKPSKRMVSTLQALRVNQEPVNFEAKEKFLSLACLPNSSTPPFVKPLNIVSFWALFCLKLLHLQDVYHS